MKGIAMAALVAAFLFACRRPLQPGETRCTSRPDYLGGTDTTCRSGPPAAAEATVTGWWCTTSASGLGICVRQPGECEMNRGDGFSPCASQSTAICAESGGYCFTTPDACVDVERQAGRDGRACVAKP
jgi:hypothetical protein